MAESRSLSRAVLLAQSSRSHYRHFLLSLKFVNYLCPEFRVASCEHAGGGHSKFSCSGGDTSLSAGTLKSLWCRGLDRAREVPNRTTLFLDGIRLFHPEVTDSDLHEDVDVQIYRRLAVVRHRTFVVVTCIRLAWDIVHDRDQHDGNCDPENGEATDCLRQILYIENGWFDTFW